MIKNNIILEIEKLLDNKKILDYNILSDSFGINCLKIETEEKERYIVKYYYKKGGGFNAIKSEADNILFLNSHKYNFFPKIINNKIIEPKPHVITDKNAILFDRFSLLRSFMASLLMG